MAIVRKLLASLAMIASLSLGVAPAQAACDAYGYISNGGTSAPLEDVYHEDHFCGTCDHQEYVICERWNKLVLPNIDNRNNLNVGPASDLVPIPHRGLWGPHTGYPGPSENGPAAIYAAYAADYPYIEIDASMTDDGDIYLSHYFTMEPFGGSRNVDPTTKDMAELEDLYMRKRDQELSSDLSDGIMQLQQALAWAHDNDFILMIDPKIGKRQEGSTPATKMDTYHRLIARIIIIADEMGYGINPRYVFKNFAIKTTENYLSTWQHLDANLYNVGLDAAELFPQVMWSPVVNKSTGDSLSDSKTFINGWMAEKHSIATFEVSLFSENHWSSQCIDGTFPNLISYVLDKTKRRPAMWSVDAMSDKGTLGRKYDWKFIGNTQNDIRGNPIVTLSYRDAMYAAINTDRPDWYGEMVLNEMQPGQTQAPNPCTL